MITAKQVTATERAALIDKPGNVIHVIEKAGLSGDRLISEIRHALLPR